VGGRGREAPHCRNKGGGPLKGSVDQKNKCGQMKEWTNKQKRRRVEKRKRVRVWNGRRMAKGRRETQELEPRPVTRLFSLVFVTAQDC